MSSAIAGRAQDIAGEYHAYTAAATETGARVKDPATWLYSMRSDLLAIGPGGLSGASAAAFWIEFWSAYRLIAAVSE